MGVYYFYINDTKKEYFCTDPSGQDIKQYALGRNVGSRALSYLLLDNDPYYTGVEHPLIGSWMGDHFFVSGDDYYEKFKQMQSDYRDIGQDIIEMLVSLNPFDLFHHGGVKWLVRLIEGNDHVTLTKDMREQIRQEFERSYHLRADEDVKRIIDALASQ